MGIGREVGNVDGAPGRRNLTCSTEAAHVCTVIMPDVAA
jgi:hypothetical protein